MADDQASASRVRPDTTSDTEFFWTAGFDGVLRILGCSRCAYLIHPPAPYCPHCGSREVAPRDVSGQATVYTYTVLPAAHGADGATIVAIVELAEQQGLRLMTNIVRCEPDSVRINQRVQVIFEACADLMIPLFEPADLP